MTRTHSRQVPLKSLVLSAALVVLTIGLVIFSKRPKPVIGPGMLPPEQTKATVAAYKAGGWVPLQEPDSRFVPGTIFQAIPGQFPQWLSSLETCGVPRDVLNPITNDSGSFKYSGDSTYGVNAVLAIHGVTAGPDFGVAQTVTFEQSGAGASGIDIIKVGEWLIKNSSTFSPLCKSYLSKPSTYVAQDSYRVARGTYTLKDSKNAAVSLKGLQMKILNLSPDANAKITGDSSLTLIVPVYTAVHRAVYAHDMLDPGRGVELSYADEQINQGLPH